MSLIVRKTRARSILSPSRIPGADYCINPYTGCSHACRYCYATFMKRFTGHTERWGSFVDVKENAPELLRGQLRKATPGTVMLSSVTDPYQPVERRHRITRECLEILAEHELTVHILTKSPLVLRDIDVLKRIRSVEVGITITTEDERMRKVFEPGAPPERARMEALRTLHESGIATYVFIGPVLPMNPEALAGSIRPYAGSVLIDRMNYRSKTAGIYSRLKLSRWLDDDFVSEVIVRLKRGFSDKEVTLCS